MFALDLSYVICCDNYIQDKKPRYTTFASLHDFDKMQTMLEAYDWEDALNSLDLYQAWDVFVSCYEILKKCVPYCVPKRKKNAYMTREALSARKKNIDFRNDIRKSSGTKPGFSLYCKARNELCSLTRSLSESHEERITSNIKTNQLEICKFQVKIEV